MVDDGHMHTVFGSMSEETFSRLREFIQNELGIKMPETKKSMLQSRLLKRLRAVGKTSYGEYCDYVFGSRGMNRELAHMIDVITTNKTDFFREPKHFEYLVQKTLPVLIRSGGRRALRIWSAGCSTGEEPYTLAMVLNEFAERRGDFRYSILATDISTRVLEKAMIGIYRHADAEPIPMRLRKKYLLRSKDKSKGQVRIIPELRSAVRFRVLNLMEDDFSIRRDMDVIFCRNVIIYFDKSTQESVLNRLCRQLKPGGYMFMGHSETLNSFRTPLVPVGPTIYRKPG